MFFERSKLPKVSDEIRDTNVTGLYLAELYVCVCSQSWRIELPWVLCGPHTGEVGQVQLKLCNKWVNERQIHTVGLPLYIDICEVMIRILSRDLCLGLGLS